MRILLDTNVLISAFITRGGRCADVYSRCTSQHVLVTTPEIIAELKEKLSRKFHVSEPEIELTIAALSEDMEAVEPVELPFAVSRDPDDDLVIAAAVGGRCDLIITGDRDLLDLGEHGGIRIVSPGDFWRTEADAEL